MILFLLLVSLLILAIGLFIMFDDDPIIGIIIFAIGAFVGKGGLEYKDLRNELRDTQQQVLSIQNGHKAVVENLQDSLADTKAQLDYQKEITLQLTFQRDEALNKASSCIEKQESAQSTLSGIKEILEN